MVGENRPLAEPSWPRVIGTTLRLWVQRHVLSARHHPEAGHRLRASAVSVVIVLLVAAVAVLALDRTHGDEAPQPAAANSPPPQDAAALAAASATRQQAAAWVAAQVSRGVIVTCDPLMCAALQQRGFPAADLSAIGAASGDPLGSGIVLSTAAVRSQFGTRLGRVYAPVVIASFGAGPSQVQVRVIAIGGAAAYLTALRTDLRARKAAGQEILRNRNIRAPAAARRELAAGLVDSRLLMTLAVLAARFGVRVRSFGDAGPGIGTAGPLRMMTLSAPTTKYLSRLLGFLGAQRAPLQPVVSSRRHGQMATVQIEFTAPSPLGLLTAGTQQ